MGKTEQTEQIREAQICKFLEGIEVKIVKYTNSFMTQLEDAFQKSRSANRMQVAQLLLIVVSFMSTWRNKYMNNAVFFGEGEGVGGFWEF